MKFKSFDAVISKLGKNFSELPTNLSDGLKQLVSNPLAIAILVVLLIALILVIRFKKVKFTADVLAKVALTVAIAIILNNIVFLKMPQGGSVTLVSMLPIFIIAFAYGPEIGFLAGFIFGIINFFMGPYIVHPIQVLFDYPLPYMFLGAAGYFRKHMNIGVIVGALLRFICHYISGLVFFASSAEGTGMSPEVFSFVYNIQYVGIELILVIIVLNILPMNRLVKAINRNAQEVRR